MTAPTILVTGFEPFGKHEVNPSAAIAMCLDGSSLGAHRVVGVEMPVAAGEVQDALTEAIERTSPELVLGLGLAGGRAMMGLERVAINVLDFSLPDNRGRDAVDEPIVAGGPAAYFASLPLKAILSAWKENGIPGYVSNTAGTYICNQIFYCTAHLAGRYGYRMGFIHVPCSHEQAASMQESVPSMALDVMRRAIEIALQVSLAVNEDLRIPAGSVS